MANKDSKNIDGNAYVRYRTETRTGEELLQRTESFYQMACTRRSVRSFSDRPVPRKVLENIVKTASTAPSGANKQPWTFCLVSDPDLKRKIREGAEKEEYENYHNRMSDGWLEDLKPLGTDWHKPFLETAPWLVVVFKKPYEVDARGEKTNNYYVNESVGLACGNLILAIHHAGLAALTHTPSPMNFLKEILNRPENERPFLLIPVGYPAEETWVPDIRRKGLDEICEVYE